MALAVYRNRISGLVDDLIACVCSDLRVDISSGYKGILAFQLGISLFRRRVRIHAAVAVIDISKGCLVGMGLCPEVIHIGADRVKIRDPVIKRINTCHRKNILGI